MSPTDLLDSVADDEITGQVTVSAETGEIIASGVDDGNRARVERFLHQRRAAKRDVAIWLGSPGTRSGPEPIVVRFGDQVVGVGAWSATPGPGRHARLHLHVDERHPGADRAVDYILERTANVCRPSQLWRFNVTMPRDQIKTRETALVRGFQRQEDSANDSAIELSRVAIKGVVVAHSWRRFRNDFKDATGIGLADEMPSHAELVNTGIVLSREEASMRTMSLFDFETFISPGMLIGRDRNSVIVPIKEAYAEELLPVKIREQGLLFSHRDAAFRLERAYFLSAGKHAVLPHGTLIVFYVSGDLGQAVASARVTFSDTTTAAWAASHLSRQGVLAEEELHERANDRGKITTFTFDNLVAFPRRIDFRELKQMGCVGGANLVTAQRISNESLGRIVERSFGVKF